MNLLCDRDTFVRVKAADHKADRVDISLFCFVFFCSCVCAAKQKKTQWNRSSLSRLIARSFSAPAQTIKNSCLYTTLYDYPSTQNFGQHRPTLLRVWPAARWVSHCGIYRIDNIKLIRATTKNILWTTCSIPNAMDKAVSHKTSSMVYYNCDQHHILSLMLVTSSDCFHTNVVQVEGTTLPHTRQCTYNSPHRHVCVHGLIESGCGFGYFLCVCVVQIVAQLCKTPSSYKVAHFSTSLAKRTRAFSNVCPGN